MALKGYKEILRVGTPGAVGSPECIRAVLDVAVDGGAVATYPIIGECKEQILVHSVKAKVQTAFLGSGSLKLGTTADDAALMTAKNAAALLINTVQTTLSNVVVAAGQAINAKIETAVFTAGKIEVEIYFTRF